MNLEGIIQHSHQSPLSGDFGFAALGEASEPECFIDVAEYRFDDAETHAVDEYLMCLHS